MADQRSAVEEETIGKAQNGAGTSKLDRHEHGGRRRKVHMKGRRKESRTDWFWMKLKRTRGRMRWVNWALHTALQCLLISRVKAFLLGLMHSSANEGRENALSVVIETGLRGRRSETATHWIGKWRETTRGTMIKQKVRANCSCVIISLLRALSQLSVIFVISPVHAALHHRPASE